MTDAIEQYGRLSPWKPEALAGWRVGDLADAPTLGRVEIIELIPPSLLQVRTAAGGIAKVGWRALTRVEAKR